MKSKECIEKERTNLIEKIGKSSNPAERQTYTVIVGWLSWILEDD